MADKKTEETPDRVTPLDAQTVRDLMEEGRRLRDVIETRLAPMRTPTNEQLKARAR